jgi:hypothetical protein
MKQNLCLTVLLIAVFISGCKQETPITRQNDIQIPQKMLSDELGFKVFRENEKEVTIYLENEFEKRTNYAFIYKGNYNFAYEYNKEAKVFNCKFENPDSPIIIVDLKGRKIIKSYEAGENPCENVCCMCYKQLSDEYMCEAAMRPYWGDEPGWICDCMITYDCEDCDLCPVTITAEPSIYLFIDAAYVNFKD